MELIKVPSATSMIFRQIIIKKKQFMDKSTIN